MNNIIDEQLLRMLRDFFAERSDIELALLIGSRATGVARENSDWDFAIQWHKEIPYMDTMGKTEILRAALAKLLSTTDDRIDIVDMPTARLAIRSAIAKDGIFLMGDNHLSWSHFLLRTWRDLEEFYWERRHAA